MRRKGSRRQVLGVLLVALAVAVPVEAQEQTVGLFLNDPGAFKGYTLFNSLSYHTAYLIDNRGLEVNSWETAYPPGLSLYLLENGNLLRAALPGIPSPIVGGGMGGLIQELDWDGNLVWEYVYITDTYRQHHDIEPLPNGNILIVAWEAKSISEAIEAGMNPAQLNNNDVWPDHIVEVQPLGSFGGTIVWEWHAWDHLIQDYDSLKANYGVVADHPELLDANFALSAGDWLHTNSIDYHAGLDQILLSSRNWNEIWVIDHSTTTEEAAGHSGGKSGMGGDILYRWGNPLAYRAGSSPDQQLYGQHNAQWIDAGLPGADNMLVFNNGFGRPGPDFSTVDEIIPPLDEDNLYYRAADSAYGPASPVWQYVAPNPTDFNSSFISGAQRQPNGNTLICSGATGTFFEVDPADTTVWLYVNPVSFSGPMEQGDTPFGNTAFRAERYPRDFPGFTGKDLTPGDPIEIYPAIACSDIQDLRARCLEGGALQAMVRMVDTSSDGSTITMTVDSVDTFVVSIFNAKAVLQLAGYSAGEHIVSIVDPPNCLEPATTSCSSLIGELAGMAESDVIPDRTALHSNYPNPFNPSTSVEFGVRNAEWVTLRIYDSSGQLVRTLVDAEMAAGNHRVQWDGTNATGEQVASGIYLYRMTAGEFSQTRQMLLMR